MRHIELISHERIAHLAQFNLHEGELLREDDEVDAVVLFLPIFIVDLVFDVKEQGEGIASRGPEDHFFECDLFCLGDGAHQGEDVCLEAAAAFPQKLIRLIMISIVVSFNICDLILILSGTSIELASLVQILQKHQHTFQDVFILKLVSKTPVKLLGFRQLFQDEFFFLSRFLFHLVQQGQLVFSLADLLDKLLQGFRRL
mmetsp:Transcript_11922/g.11823  ORF Transcript_11922/g.11823 Transcript_11922/m.11823 type:complete len:200 (-) Transcript_11922:249-848(-)